jgi:hypothetical protein
VAAPPLTSSGLKGPYTFEITANDVIFTEKRPCRADAGAALVQLVAAHIRELDAIRRQLLSRPSNETPIRWSHA